MPTTIQISNSIKKTLERMKMFNRESYNDIIERMLEDNLEINEKTKKEIDEARKRIQTGKFTTQEQIEKDFDL